MSFQSFPAVAGTVGANAGKLIDVADTVSNVGPIVSNRRTMNTIKNMAGQMESGIAAVNQYDNQIVQYVPMQAQHKGIIEGLVSSITEKTHAKPQRKVMNENYISSTLLPEFKSNMKQEKESARSSALEKINCNLLDFKATAYGGG